MEADHLDSPEGHHTHADYSCRGRCDRISAHFSPQQQTFTSHNDNSSCRFTHNDNAHNYCCFANNDNTQVKSSIFRCDCDSDYYNNSGSFHCDCDSNLHNNSGEFSLDRDSNHHNNSSFYCHSVSNRHYNSGEFNLDCNHHNNTHEFNFDRDSNPRLPSDKPGRCQPVRQLCSLLDWRYSPLRRHTLLQHVQHFVLLR